MSERDKLEDKKAEIRARLEKEMREKRKAEKRDSGLSHKEKKSDLSSVIGDMKKKIIVEVRDEVEKEWSKKLDKKNNELNDIQGQYKELEIKYDELIQQFNDQKKLNDVTINDLEMKLKDTSSSYDEVKKSLELLQKDINDKNSSITDLNTQLTSLQSTYDQLEKDSNEKLLSLTNEHTIQIESLNTSISTVQKRKRRYF
ncbi:hypothetical protein QTN25_007706 [Entamoeba marina]